MAEKIVVALWAEEFAGFREFDTKAEAIAFADGWGSGGNEYGEGHCVGYVLPDDECELSPKNLEVVRREMKKSE